jgi:drug/metabolite transporter (DMT)-like permease
VLTVLTGLLTSLSYATSDMFSQRVARGTRPLTQMVWVLVTGAVIIVPVALLVDGLPQGDEWRGAGLAALAGALYFGAFFCLLHGLQVGDLGLVSALTALQGAYVAVAVILLGAPVTVPLAVALGLCAFGAVFTSFEGRARSARGAPWALVAGALFAGAMLCYAYGDISWLSQVAISRSVSLLITLPVALFTGSVAVPRELRVRAVGAAILELSGVLLLTITFAPADGRRSDHDAVRHLCRDPRFRAPSRAPQAEPVGRHRLRDCRREPAGAGGMRRRAPAALLPPPHTASTR